MPKSTIRSKGILKSKMKKVIVTGGAGYIGSHTVVELVDSGYEPIVIDDFSNSNRNVMDRLAQITGRNIVLYEGQVQDEGLLDKVMQDHPDIDSVIHFAANKAVGESVRDPLKYYSNNLNSTLAVLTAMEKYGVEKLVFSSSCTVYGQPDTLPVTEETPRQKAESPYGNTKQICEDIIGDFIKKGSIKSISLRYFNPIGAHESALIGELPLGVPENLVPYITQTAAGKRESLTVFGDDYDTPDGTCIRDYIHVVDLAKAHVKSIDHLGDKENGFYDVFNLGIGKGSTVLEVIQTFEEVNGLKLNYSIGPRRPGDVEKIYADTSKSNREMGWRTELSLSDALRSAWKWEKTLMD